MDLLQGLTNLMGGGASQARPNSGAGYGAQPPAADAGGGLESMLGSLLGGGGSGAGGAGGLSSLLGSSGLGGLVGALMGGGGSSGSSAAGGDSLGGLGSLLGSLMGGASAPALDQHHAAVANDQQYAQYGRQQAAPAANPQDAVVRMLRTIVYAAKADGHIDKNEQNIILGQLDKLNFGNQGKAMVQQMINEPLNPASIANGVTDPKEALRLYGLSSAVCGADDPSERRYLDALASALRLPANVKNQIDAQIRG